MRLSNLLARRSHKDEGLASSNIDPQKDRSASRRALVTGGIAAAGAVLASSARAAVTYVKLGSSNSATAATIVTNTTTDGAGLIGNALSGLNANGVRGQSASGTGVRGRSSSGTGVRGEGTGTSSYGVRGSGGYAGLYGSGGSYGVIGSGSTVGLYGSGGTYGVYCSGSSYGVYASSSSYGVYASGTNYGVYATGSTYGVVGTTAHPNVPAVYGSGGQYGVQGVGGRTAGVRGDSGYVGVWGEGADWGFFSIATRTTGQNYGIMAETLSKTSGYAGWFKGNVRIEGTLSKNAGAFKIDHPLDPERKWLQHSLVESPDMMNVYNGNVTTDSAGYATVELPAYFGALNGEFRYQLTVIGRMAQAIVDKEIVNNRFRIRTSEARVKVSWQVTGIRQDAYARAHRIKVETLKPRVEQGTRQFLPSGVVGRQMNYGPTSAPK